MSASSSNANLPPPPPQHSQTPQPASLTLIIRFGNTSLPDLPLSVYNPSTANAATICTLIRPHLPPHLSTCPLRLIYAGALLNSSQALTVSLRLPSSSPTASTLTPSQPHQQQQQRYIHCAISSETHLTPTDLSAEQTTAASLLHLHHQPSSSLSLNDTPSPDLEPSPTTPTIQTDPEPRGFDRLASTGFTPAEITALRSQFLAITAHAHTPDTMPTAAQMRVLEERWLDGDTTTTATAGTPSGAPGTGADEDESDPTNLAASGLEDMLWGNLMGFFWAVGAAVWLVREPGVWSQRRQVGVVTGLVVNLALCLLGAGG